MIPIKKPGRKIKPYMRDIRKYQKSTNLLLRKLSFQRKVREVTSGLGLKVRFTSSALLAIQEATESYLVGLY